VYLPQYRPVTGAAKQFISLPGAGTVLDAAGNAPGVVMLHGLYSAVGAHPAPNRVCG
jgi:hypothetical protein